MIMMMDDYEKDIFEIKKLMDRGINCFFNFAKAVLSTLSLHLKILKTCLSIRSLRLIMLNSHLSVI